MLNKEQQIVFDYFTLERQADVLAGYYILNAKAGTGKTFLVKELFKGREENSTILLTPTHKALSLYSDLYIPSYALMTIHKFLGSEKDYDDEGNVYFPFRNPSLNKNLTSNCLIIIDEASMVSSEMLEKFDTLVRDHPILFTCDECQLPPVKESISPIFNLDYTRFELNQNMRSNQSSSAIWVEQFRMNVGEPTIQRIRIPISSFTKSVPDMLDDFKTQQDVVLLTWTNKRKDYWNDRVRRYLFGDDCAPVCVSEKLVFSGCRKAATHHYYTSSIIEVVSVERKTEFIPFEPAVCGCQRLKSLLSPKQGESTCIKGCTKCGLCARRVLGYDVNFYYITDQNNTTWYIPETEKDRKRIKDFISHYKTYILADKIMRRHLWPKMYAIKDKYCPVLEYSYVSTIHKAQGSEWQNVYIDYVNIYHSEPDQRDRLLYTAVSRMRQNLYAIDSSSLHS